MRHPALILFLVLAAAVGLWLAFGGTGSDSPGPDIDPASDGAPAAAPPAPAEGSAPGATARTASAVERAAHTARRSLETPPGLVAGRVTDKDTGGPVTAFHLRFTNPVEREGWKEIKQAVTDPRGRFSLVVPPARLDPAARPRLAVVSPRHRPLRLEGPALTGDPARLALVLDGGLTLSGKVVEAGSGKPIPGALVASRADARSAWGLPGEGGRFPWARTDAQGAFSLGGLQKGYQRIFAVHPGWAQAWTGVDPAVGKEVVVRLGPGVHIHGRALTDAGKPAAGLPIRVRGRHLCAPQETRTGADGTYRTPALPAGHLWLQADRGFAEPAPDPGDFTPEMRRVKLGSRDLRLDFGPRPGQIAWQGVVRDGLGRPLPGATVGLFPLERNPGQGTARARADQSGHFLLRKLVKGRYYLRITLGRAGVAVRGRSLNLDHQGTLEKDIRIPHCSLSGRVVGPDGKAPPPGVAFNVEGYLEEGEDGATCTADAEGRFQLLGLQPGTYRLTAKARDYPVVVREGVQVVHGQDSGGHLLQVQAGATLLVRIRPGEGGKSKWVHTRDGEGRERTWFNLRFAREGGETLTFPRERVDDRGAYKVDKKLLPGTWKVSVTFIGCDPVVKEVTLARGDKAQLVFAADEFKASDWRDPGSGLGPITVAGSLRDHRGKPLAGVELYFVGMNLRHLAFKDRYVKGRTDAKGEFRLPGFRPGTWRVSGRTPDGGEPEFNPLVIPKRCTETCRCDLVLPGGRLLGRLADAVTGTPLGKKEPLWWTFLRDVESGRIVAQLNGGHRGPRFTMVGIPAGKFTLMVRAAGYRMHTTEPFRLAAGQSLDLGTILLKLDVRLDLTVLDPQGRPVEHYVLVVNGEPQPSHRRTDRGQGCFRYLDLPTGAIRLRIKAEGFKEVVRRVELRPGKPLPVTIRLQPR